MEISALASGSSGNCFYIGGSNSGVLVDAGISCKQIINRLNLIGKSPRNIKGILITHEHTDHIRGADVFARNFNIPIFATKKTSESTFLCSDSELINNIKNNENFKLAGIEIQAFSKSHRCIDPILFSLKNKKKVSIITDAGYGCKNIIENISDSEFLCLESNHDIDMLENGSYPYYIKKWIKSDVGHLSNTQAALVVLEHASAKLKNIILSHLSEKNNAPEIAVKTFKRCIKERYDLKLNLDVSTKFNPTRLYRI
jgi:phosphoribosyl 1,2-cyclic phosphodiesterase